MEFSENTNISKDNSLVIQMLNLRIAPVPPNLPNQLSSCISILTILQAKPLPPKPGSPQSQTLHSQRPCCKKIKTPFATLTKATTDLGAGEPNDGSGLRVLRLVEASGEVLCRKGLKTRHDGCGECMLGEWTSGRSVAPERTSFKNSKELRYLWSLPA